MGRRVVVLLLVFPFLVPGVLRAQDAPSMDGPGETTPAEMAEETPTDTEVEVSTADSETQFQLGYRAYQQGNLDEAIQRLETALDVDTEFTRARYWLGSFYYVNGNNDSAIQTWENHRPTSSLQPWFQREIDMHRQRYGNQDYQLGTDWSFVGMAPGRLHGRKRLTNPSAITPAPDGGWYASSYQLGRIIRYSTEGRVLDVYEGFGRPVDLHYREERGLLVLNGEDGTVLRLSDTGAMSSWGSGLSEGAQKLLSMEDRLYLFNIARGDLVQLSSEGETVATVWEPGPQRNINDVTVGPDNRFWVLDRDAPEILVIDRFGEVIRRIPVPSTMPLRRIWWQKNELLGVDNESLYRLDPESLDSQQITTSPGSIEGGQVSDLILRGNQAILTLFEESGVAVYRFGRENQFDMLVQARRPEFRKFPIIRLRMLIEDPLEMGRFRDLTDGHVEIDVDNQKVLPSLFRHTSSVYSAGWYMIVDDRMSDRRWQEVEPQLLDFVTNAPDESRGTVWSLRENNVLQGLTDRKVPLRNAVGRVQVAEEGNPSDTALRDLLDTALDSIFQRRGAHGVILVSNHVSSSTGDLQQIAQRLRNNQIPLIVINPSVDRLSESHPFRSVAPSRYYDFHNPSLDGAWRHYRRQLDGHYTAIFRSTLSYQQSNEWRPYELIFQWYNSTFRYDGAYIIP